MLSHVQLFVTPWTARLLCPLLFRFLAENTNMWIYDAILMTYIHAGNSPGENPGSLSSSTVWRHGTDLCMQESGNTLINYCYCLVNKNILVSKLCDFNCLMISVNLGDSSKIFKHKKHWFKDIKYFGTKSVSQHFFLPLLESESFCPPQIHILRS